MALPITRPTNHRGITRSEVRKSNQSKSGCVVALAYLSPLGLSSHFQALEGSAKRQAQSTDLEAGDQYTHLSYLEPAVRLFVLSLRCFSYITKAWQSPTGHPYCAGVGATVRGISPVQRGTLHAEKIATTCRVLPKQQCQSPKASICRMLPAALALQVSLCLPRVTDCLSTTGTGLPGPFPEGAAPQRQPLAHTTN